MIVIFEIKYVSEGGTAVIGGGEHPLMNATAIDGLGVPDPRHNTVEYSDTAGQYTTGSKDLARIITISGDIIGGQAEIEAFYKAIYHEGELLLTFDLQKRKIKCRLYSADDLRRYAGCDVSGFTVQFIADNPYFSDFEQTRTYIIKKTDLFPNTEENGELYVTLPSVATTTVAETELNFISDIPVYPTIYLLNEGGSATLSDDSGVLIEIFNSDGERRAKIDLNIATSDGELITVDLPHRKVISSVSGVITNTISDDTVMSDFFLGTGYNKITAVNRNTAKRITAWLEYSPAYITAVY